MNIKATCFIVGITIFFCSCMHVSSSTTNKAERTDFTTISNQLLDMLNHNLIDSSIEQKDIPDIDIRKALLDMGISRVYINGKPREGFLDSIVVYVQDNKNISIRIYKWDKFTTIMYDYAKRTRDLSEKGNEFSTPTQKIKDRLYVCKSKEPRWTP